MGDGPAKRKGASTVRPSKGKSAVKRSRAAPHQREPSPDTPSEFSSEEDDQPLRLSMGEAPRALGAMPCVPRTGHVGDTTREKIRKGEFVHFGSLLVPGDGTSKNRSSRQREVGSDEEAAETLSIFDWEDAFINFMSTRTGYFPSECQGLLRHWQVVRSFYRRGRDGVDYDLQFRRLKARHEDIKWGEYMTELADETRFRKPAKPRGAMPRQERPMGSGPVPYVNRRTTWAPTQRGIGFGRHSAMPQTCFSYNTMKGCSMRQCKFAHRCASCLSPGHNRLACARR